MSEVLSCHEQSAAAEPPTVKVTRKAMTDKNSKHEKQSQPSTTSGGGTGAPFTDDDNTVNQQQSHGDHGGRVVGVYVPGHLHAPRVVTDVHVKPGETVRPHGPVVTVSWMGSGLYPGVTPAPVTVPSPCAGIIESVLVTLGGKVRGGHLIATVRVWDSK
jgi:hypothetical protein